MIAPVSKTMSLMGLRPTGDFGPLTSYTSKRGKHVWFLKAPPTSPPTNWQIKQRNRFRIIGKLWHHLTAQKRADWLAAATRANLNITGYNLFVWFHTVGDRQTLATLEQQSGVTLLP